MGRSPLSLEGEREEERARAGGKEEPVVDPGLLSSTVGALERPRHPSVVFASVAPAWLPDMGPHSHSPE